MNRQRHGCGLSHGEPKYRDTLVGPKRGLMPAKNDHFYTIGSEVLSGFEIVARLGRGQFGEVWKVRERDNDREFAAKVINLEENESGFKEIRALKLVAKLNHIHLVKIQTFQVRQRNGELVPFKELDQFLKTQRKKLRELVIVMELGDQSLSDRLRDYQEQTNTMGGLPVPELQRYLLGAARGIDYLYGNNQIVHCDIKPANLLIFGQDVKVADCGVAVSVSGGGTQTVSMSPYYSPPELNRNRPGQWTDQYSLAVTYYELRTGLLPFDRRLGPFDVMRIHDEGRLAFDSPVLKPSEREVLCLATSVNAADRFPTCEVFAEQIDRAHKNLPIMRPDECGPSPAVVVKVKSLEVSPKSTHSTGNPPHSGEITFDRNLRRQDKVRTDDIEKLVEDSRSPDETMRPPQVDYQSETSGLKSKGEAASEGWAGGTMQLGQPMPSVQAPSSKFLTRPSDAETDWGSSSKSRPRTKKPSLIIPAIAVSLAMLMALGGIGFAVWKSGKSPSEDSNTVVKTEEKKKVESEKASEIVPIKTAPPPTFDLKNLLTLLGDDASVLMQGPTGPPAKAREWLTSQTSITVAERDQADKIFKSVEDRIARHQQFLTAIPKKADSAEVIRQFARELAKPIEEHSFLQSTSPQHREWANRLEASFESLANKARVDAFTRLLTEYEAKPTISIEERLQYLSWLEDESGGKKKSLPQHERWDSRVESLTNQFVANANEADKSRVLNYFFNLDDRRVFSNSSVLRYSLLTPLSKSKLEAWDRPIRERTVSEAVQKLDDDITSVDPKSLADFDRKCRTIYDSANTTHVKKHDDANPLNPDCLMPQAKSVVSLWRNAEKTGDLSEVRRRLIEQAYANRESLDRSLAKEYMAIALTVKSPESIAEQRSVQRVCEETNSQFQKNLSVVVKAKLQTADEPNWSDIASLCDRDSALGWSAAAAAEASLARRDHDLQAGNAPQSTKAIPADSADSPEDLKNYLAYLRAWNLLQEGRPPKPTVFQVESKPAIRVERTLALVTAFNGWRNEMRSFATDFRQRVVADEIMRTIVAVPQPSEKPLEEFGRNPYRSGDVNALIGLAEETLKNRPATTWEAAHLALLYAARPDHVVNKIVIQKLLDSAKLPETPDGSVHPQIGLAFFQLRYDEKRPDAAIPMVRYWLTDHAHFAAARTDRDRMERAKRRWEKVGAIIESLPADERPSARALRSHYRSLVLLHSDEKPETFTKAMAGLFEGESELPPFERAISLAWRSYAALLEFADNPKGESNDNDARRTKWDRLFRDAEESIRLFPNPRAHFVLAYRHFAEGDTRNVSNLKAPRETRGTVESQRATIDRTMRHFEAACRGLGLEPNSDFWKSRAAYAFYWGLQVGKHGGRTEDVRALLDDARTAVERVIEQYPERDPEDLKLKASILEDFAWLVGDNRAKDYQLALQAIDEAITLIKPESPDRVKYRTESLRILRRAMGQRSISREEFQRRLRLIDAEMKDRMNLNGPYRLQRAIVKGYEDDSSPGDSELIELAIAKIDETTLPLAIILAERWYVRHRSGRGPDAELIKKLDTALADAKMLPPYLSYQTAYLKGLLEVVRGRTAEARDQFTTANDDIQRMLRDGKLNMEWPFPVRSALVSLEIGFADGSSTRRARTVTLLQELQKRFSNHFLDDDLERIRKITSSP